MNRIAGIATLMLCWSLPALAQPSAEDKARYDAVVRDAQISAEQVLATLPPITDPQTRGTLLRYNLAARAWWAGRECKFGNPDNVKFFQADMTLFTEALGLLFASQFRKTPDEADATIQTLQMHALNALRANKFFDCLSKAGDIWLVGRRVAQDVADHLRPQLQTPKQ